MMKLLLVASSLMCASAAPLVVTHDVSTACIHAVETAPPCAANTTLFAYLGRAKGNSEVQMDNCATCACNLKSNDQFALLNSPERGASDVYDSPSWGRCCNGWNGTRCDVCATKEACPPIEGANGPIDAVECTSGAVEPVAAELAGEGKRYSCQPCGPGAESAYCRYTVLPGASLDVVAFTDHAEIAMRLGTFRNDAGRFDGQNSYDYAAMFLGNLTGCAFSREPCRWNSEKTCVTLTCAETSINCPPRDLSNCPGFTYDTCRHKYVCLNECLRKNFAGCCVSKTGDDDDLMHGHRYHVNQPLCCAEGDEESCEATELFWNGVATTFSCEVGPLVGATLAARRCYLNQRHTGVEDGFPYTCHVGNCLYNATNATVVISDDSAVRYNPQPSAVWQLVALGLLAVAAVAAVALGYYKTPLRKRPVFFVARPKDDEDPEADAVPLDVEWRDVTMTTLEGGYVVLQGVSGKARSGRVTAVLGPSGAGKSSLLGAICGRADESVYTISGTITCGDAPLNARDRRQTMAMVSQSDESLVAQLTVEEHLAFHARLRCPLDVQRSVDEQIQKLDLQRCRSRVVGMRPSDDDDDSGSSRGISGGEARRLTVAAEMLSRPRVLCLDEPTSRLDAHQALQLAKILRETARQGVTVLATLHQPRPEIFEDLLDDIVLLNAGRLAWRGSRTRASAIAARLDPTVNAADLLLDCVATDLLRDEEHEEEQEQQDEALLKAALEDARFVRVSASAQLRLLVERQLIRSVRSPALVMLHLGGSLGAALALGSIDRKLPRDLGGAQRRIGVVFFALFFETLLALSALSALREDSRVAEIEAKSMGGLYSAKLRFLSIVLVDGFVLRLTPALLFSAVAYPLVGLRSRCAGLCALRFAAALSLTSCAAGLAALTLAACRFKNSQVTVALGGLGVLFAALFGGVAIDVDSPDTANADSSTGHTTFSALALKSAASLDAMYHGFRAAVVGELAGAKDRHGHPLTYVIDGHKCDDSFPSVVVSVDAILATLNLPLRPREADIALLKLACLVVVWVAVAFFVDSRCSSKKKKKKQSTKKKIQSHADYVALEAQDMPQEDPGSPDPGSPDPGSPDPGSPEPATNPIVSIAMTCLGRGGPLSSTRVGVLSRRLLRPSPIATRGPSDDEAEDSDAESEADALELLLLLLQGPPDDDAGCELECASIDLSVGKSLRVLRECSLRCAGGGVTALLGPSGAGKSSLLDVLAGRRTSGRVEGIVTVAGVVATAATRRRLSDYAPQDDVLPPTLSAREHLEFHARLRLPATWTARRTSRLAVRQATRLGLDRDRLEVRLSALSGGQRRRVTLATSLIARKRLLFADEPTTGLDSTTALLVVGRLARVAARSRLTLVSVLHQPRAEIFEKLDGLALLCQGALRFAGTPNDAREFLHERGGDMSTSSGNAADLLVDACVDFRDDDSPPYRQQAQPRAAATSRPSFATSRKPSFAFQLRLLAARELTNVARGRLALVLHYVPPLVMGLVLGFVYADMPGRDGTAAGIQDRLGLSFIVCAYTALQTLTAPPRSRRAARLLARERDSYGTAGFFVASELIADALALRVLPPVLLALPAAAISRCTRGPAELLAFVAATVQLHYALAAVGRLVGSVSPRDAVASASASLIVLFSLLLCGFFVAPTDLTAPWRLLGASLPTSHGFQALAVHEFVDVNDLFITSKIGGAKVKTGPYTGAQILSCFGFGVADATNDHLALLALSVVADFGTYLSLAFLAFEKR